MTRGEAIEIRQFALNGGEVTALQLQEAIYVITRSRLGRPPKFRLPEIPRPVKDLANATLAFNLGLAVGKAKSEAAALSRPQPQE